MLVHGSKDHILCLIQRLECLAHDINDIEDYRKLKREMEDWDWEKKTYVVKPCPIILFVLTQSGNTENACQSCGLRTSARGWTAHCIWSQLSASTEQHIWWNDTHVADRMQGVLQTIALLKSFL